MEKVAFLTVSRRHGRALDLVVNLVFVSTLLLAGCSDSGDDEDSASLKGSSPPITPTISLTTSPSSTGNNGPSTLTWLVTNAASCEASGAWSGTKALSDSEDVGPLTQTSTFILVCSGGDTRTGIESYLQEVIDAVMAIIGTESSDKLAAVRTIGSWVIEIYYGTSYGNY